VQRVTRP